jgi:GNAT superfamily N-acetyltransferase
VIRAAVAEDGHAIAEVHVASWLAAYRGLIPDEALDALDVDARAARWYASLADGTASALVAEDEAGIYGWATVGRSRDPDASGEIGELWGLYLRPDRWGQGLGRDLHDAALDELCAQGFSAATLWVLEGNARATRFYERQGWRPDGSMRSDCVGELRTLVEEARYRIELTRRT